MSDHLDAAAEHVLDAHLAARTDAELHHLSIAYNLLYSIASVGVTDDHPLVEMVDEHLDSAAASDVDDVRFHARQAQQLLWLLGGEPDGE